MFRLCSDCVQAVSQHSPPATRPRADGPGEEQQAKVALNQSDPDDFPERGMADSSERAMADSPEHAMADSPERAMADSSERAMADSSERAMADSPRLTRTRRRDAAAAVLSHTCDTQGLPVRHTQAGRNTGGWKVHRRRGHVTGPAAGLVCRGGQGAEGSARSTRTR